jgi:hypothetical protein
MAEILSPTKEEIGRELYISKTAGNNRITHIQTDWQVAKPNEAPEPFSFTSSFFGNIKGSEYKGVRTIYQSLLNRSAPF